MSDPQEPDKEPDINDLIEYENLVKMNKKDLDNFLSKYKFKTEEDIENFMSKYNSKFKEGLTKIEIPDPDKEPDMYFMAEISDESEKAGPDSLYHELCNTMTNMIKSGKPWSEMYPELEELILYRMLEGPGDVQAQKSFESLTKYKPDKKILGAARLNRLYHKYLLVADGASLPEMYVELEEIVGDKLEEDPTDIEALASLKILKECRPTERELYPARLKKYCEEEGSMGIMVEGEGLPVAAYPDEKLEQLQETVNLILGCIKRFKEVTQQDVYIFQQVNKISEERENKIYEKEEIEIYEILIENGAAKLKYEELVKMEKKDLENFLSKYKYATMVMNPDNPNKSIKHVTNDPEILGNYQNTIKLRDAVFKSFRLNKREVFQYAMYSPADQRFMYETNNRIVRFGIYDEKNDLHIASVKLKTPPPSA